MQNTTRLSTNFQRYVTLSTTQAGNYTIGKALGGSILLALSAQIYIPLYPIPVTLQTFIIMLFSFCVPWRSAAYAVLLYWSYAAVGIPVLAGSKTGMIAFMGPAAGYTGGFLLMSSTIAFLTQHGQTIGMRLGIALLGNIVCYIPGLAILAHWFDWKTAVQTGLLPFLVPDGIKMLVAAYLSGKIQHAALVLPTFWKKTR